MAMTATQFRKDLYRVFDRALDTGVAVPITRKGKTFLVVPPVQKSRLEALRKRKVIKCDPEELVHMDWSGKWQPCI
ncbi:MAG: type II toxin-antitoxin system Phd/YefM family antitoxin [Candidatus Omnitrophica bacterium]|nr:type II toxin-antitoxin system Phd/YefM family antitoxin [Candidatus Omnitrophota bacterium]